MWYGLVWVKQRKGMDEKSRAAISTASSVAFKREILGPQSYLSNFCLCLKRPRETVTDTQEFPVQCVKSLLPSGTGCGHWRTGIW